MQARQRLGTTQTQELGWNSVKWLRGHAEPKYSRQSHLETSLNVVSEKR